MVNHIGAIKCKNGPKKCKYGGFFHTYCIKKFDKRKMSYEIELSDKWYCKYCKYRKNKKQKL